MSEKTLEQAVGELARVWDGEKPSPEINPWAIMLENTGYKVEFIDYYPTGIADLTPS